jgi:rod shape-determining protein MreD
VILGPSAFLRVGVLLLLAVVLQLSAVGQITVLGGHVDLIPLVVGAVAFYAGSVSGAATGFAMGMLLDLAAGQTMGLSSLVLTAVGYGVGRFREIRDPGHGLAPIPVGAAATAGWVTAFAAVSFMLDITAKVSPLVIRDMLVTTLVGAVLAMPVFAACRRVLRPALAVDPQDARRRRRSPRETGPLGLRGMEFGGS